MSEHQFTTTSQFTKKVYRDIYPAVDPSSAALSQRGKIVGIAIAYAKANAKAIVISARKVDDLKATQELIYGINPNIEVLCAVLEVTSEESVKWFFDQIKAKFGTVDILEVNVKGQMLVAKYFLQLLGTEKEGKVIDMTSSAGLFVVPGVSAYSLGKLADLQLARYISAENSNVTAISYHPGIVLTDMHQDARGFREFSKDTTELAGGVAVWLSTKAATFLDGRFMAVNWAVDELMARKDEILLGDLLKVKLGGDFGDAVLQK
ncbi:NAD(P)-binding protein [Stipitochalara longipes BDJ]|nr:NAD(P)-binding protein [Stipitochalara longipes BDJ]